jgi:hypothetical protein
VPAADVGDPAAVGEPADHAGQGRDPLGGEAGGVAGAEEPLGALEDRGVLLMPGDAGTGAEGLGEAVNAGEPAAGEGGAAGQEGRRCLVGEHRGGLGRQRVPPVALPVGEEPGGGLLGQPLPQVAGRGAGAVGQFAFGSRTAVGECPVQPELVTDRHHGRGGRAGHRAEQPVHVLLDQFSVQRKPSVSWMDQGRGWARPAADARRRPASAGEPDMRRT